MKSKFIRCFLMLLTLTVVIGIWPVSVSAWDDQFNTGMAPPPPHGRPFDDLPAEFDTDNDGRLSSDEFPGPADHFDALDSDGDGFLSADELQQGRPGNSDDRGFEKDDTDQDGMVSLEEFSGPEDMFDRLDTDGDGYITQEEIRQFHPRPFHGRSPETGAEQE